VELIKNYPKSDQIYEFGQYFDLRKFYENNFIKNSIQIFQKDLQVNSTRLTLFYSRTNISKKNKLRSSTQKEIF